MMCVWKQQRDSKSASLYCPLAPRSLRWTKILVLTLGLLVIADSAMAQRRVVVESKTSGQSESQRVTTWTREDTRWLGSLSAQDFALRRHIVAEATNDSSVVALRSLLSASRATAGTDTAVAVRLVEYRLRDRWYARGYLGASVLAAGDTLRVMTGDLWHIGLWDLGGADFPGRKRLLSTWLPQVGDVFRSADVERGIERVLAGTGESGFPFSRWVTRELKLHPEQKLVDIKASLLPGEAAYIGPITSDLVEPRARDFLAKSSGLGQGELFQHSNLERAVDRLLARDLYTQVGTPRLYLTSAVDTVGVHFPVVARRKVNRLQVVLGLSRREEGGSRISGEVDFRLPNLGGSGRNLAILWRDDGQDKSQFGFSYMEPLAFGTGLDMALALENEVQRDVYTRFQFDNTWSLPVVALWGVDLGVGWDRSTYPLGDLESTRRVRARGGVEHKRGDRTRSGWHGLFSIETAWRSSKLRPDSGVSGALGEAVTQRIFRVDTGGELWLSSTMSAFARASFRQLTGGERNVPLSEEFRFGGAASLRGYREDEFHGSQAAWGAVELRIGRAEGSRLYTFFDLGYFQFWNTDPLALNPDELIRFRGWPRGYGLGIFARTPGGDISLAIGFPGTVDFDQAKLHVALLESF
ncbi:MAG: outer membrane protein assembly factor BamA [Candidatus Krumholzibacteriia bacterium]|jgi:outer membrane protein assembly factor BamA